jgi:hypothetical protein
MEQCVDGHQSGGKTGIVVLILLSSSEGTGLMLELPGSMQGI